MNGAFALTARGLPTAGRHGSALRPSVSPVASVVNQTEALPRISIATVTPTRLQQCAAQGLYGEPPHAEGTRLASGGSEAGGARAGGPRRGAQAVLRVVAKVRVELVGDVREHSVDTGGDQRRHAATID